MGLEDLFIFSDPVVINYSAKIKYSLNPKVQLHRWDGCKEKTENKRNQKKWNNPKGSEEDY